MAKPEKIRITINDKNEIETREVLLKGKWIEAELCDCQDHEEREGDLVIRVGAVAEPNSCTQDPRCSAPPDWCTVYAGGCLKYRC